MIVIRLRFSSCTCWHPNCDTLCNILACWKPIPCQYPRTHILHSAPHRTNHNPSHHPSPILGSPSSVLFDGIDPPHSPTHHVAASVPPYQCGPSVVGVRGCRLTGALCPWSVQQGGIAQHGMVWHSTEWNGMAHHSMGRHCMVCHRIPCHGTAPHGTAWHSKILHRMARHGMTQHGTARHGMAWHGMVHHRAHVPSL